METTNEDKALELTAEAFLFWLKRPENPDIIFETRRNHFMRCRRVANLTFEESDRIWTEAQASAEAALDRWKIHQEEHENS